MDFICVHAFVCTEKVNNDLEWTWSDPHLSHNNRQIQSVYTNDKQKKWWVGCSDALHYPKNKTKVWLCESSLNHNTFQKTLEEEM